MVCSRTVIIENYVQWPSENLGAVSISITYIIPKLYKDTLKSVRPRLYLLYILLLVWDNQCSI